MSEAVLITIIGIISSTISAIISWVLTRRKYNVGVKSDELTNLKATMEIYQCTINSLKIEVDRNSKQAEEADKITKLEDYKAQEKESESTLDEAQIKLAQFKEAFADKDGLLDYIKEEFPKSYTDIIKLLFSNIYLTHLEENVTINDTQNFLVDLIPCTATAKK